MNLTEEQQRYLANATQVMAVACKTVEQALLLACEKMPCSGAIPCGRSHTDDCGKGFLLDLSKTLAEALTKAQVEVR